LKRLLKIQENTYLYNGKSSLECKNIMFEQMPDCLTKYIDLYASKEKMIEFGERLQNSQRKRVARNAEAF